MLNWGSVRLNDLPIFIKLESGPECTSWFKSDVPYHSVFWNVAFQKVLPVVRFLVSFLFSWSLWKKLSQRRNSHIAILSGPTHTYIASGMRRKEICLLYFHKKVSKTEQLFAFHMQPLEGLSFSPAEPWGGQGSRLCAVIYCTQHLGQCLPLSQSFLTDEGGLPLGQPSGQEPEAERG